MKKIRSVLKNTRGATAIEYGLIIGLIGMAIAASLTNVTNGIDKNFDTVNTAMENNAAPSP